MEGLFFGAFFGAPCFFGALFFDARLSQRRKERNDTYAERKTAERRKERKRDRNDAYVERKQDPKP